MSYASGVLVEADSPTDETLPVLLHKIINRLMKRLTRRGVLVEEEEGGSSFLADADADSDEDRSLRPLQAAACSYRIAFGPRAGRKVLTVQGAIARDHDLCADHQGFSLHAAVRCDAGEHQRLERLFRTITRPALANERVQINSAGQVVLKLKTAWRDGTTHLVMSPLKFMQRLHLIRLHGVLPPNAGRRASAGRGCSNGCSPLSSSTARTAVVSTELRWSAQDHRRHPRSTGDKSGSSCTWGCTGRG